MEFSIYLSTKGDIFYSSLITNMNVCTTTYGEKLISKIGGVKIKDQDQFVKINSSDLDHMKDQDQLSDLDLDIEDHDLFTTLVMKSNVIFNRTHLAVAKSLQSEFKLQSIVRAHESMRPARVYLTAGDLYDSSINRSPTAYEQNPAEERALYDDNVDHEFTQLVIVSADDDDVTPIGVINWCGIVQGRDHGGLALISAKY